MLGIRVERPAQQNDLTSVNEEHELQFSAAEDGGALQLYGRPLHHLTENLKVGLAIRSVGITLPRWIWKFQKGRAHIP